ncbi:hypothetical protein [Actinomadura harenae]|uniref:Uncharacterized protein n=1 Tax=Actinomadura harenae TaxID=2483351 RepID=A0A3M2M694_9ACTN|nr:hypothetical protein [Actinomadura harenae]RMI45314.1 hypothetical protein EBO15_10330 [Actinomadura harenae]
MTRPDHHLTSITDQRPQATIPSTLAQASRDVPPLATAWREIEAEAGDVAELQEHELRMRRVRLGIGAAFFTVGAGITATALASLRPVPHLPAVTVSVVPAAVVAVAALVGLTRLAQDFTIRFTASYQVTRNGWRVRAARRWYAPGSYVRMRNAPDEFGAVLSWANDPACAEPWALIQPNGQAARFVPLHQAQPLPPRSR